MRVFVVFNLKPGVDPAEYEAWAKSTDIPVVRGLGSIAGFDVYRSTGLLGSDAQPPYAYIEVIEVADDAAFGDDVSTPQMQDIAAQFQTFADNPQFMVMQDITEAQ
ncbi:REDY-like protein HapK [Flavimaricola marinus]|uniref:REDY-like protein HapK n=1 Tax=Flavimaricola marinus TaxID=1819565 RepID=A0A238LGT0_9RHOB|nr:REDY-like protein HapK [Flavimaricola marinus]SMY08166.1 REDY-like protein HapK [Flavimaricola marinus]